MKTSHRSSYLRNTTAIAALCGGIVLLSLTVAAQTSGVWTGAGGDGLWTGDPANWFNNLVASGNGATADFSQLTLSANTTVHLDAALTIGNVIFGNTGATPIESWILDANGNPADILTLAGGSSTITVTNLGTGKVILTNVITGTSGFVKDGPGVLELDNADTFTGGTTINRGTLILGLNVTAGEQNTTDLYNLGSATGGPATLLVSMLGHNLSNPINLPTNAVGPLSLGNYGAQKADFFGNISLNGNNLIFTNGADNTSNSKFLVSDTVTGVGNITCINNSPAGNFTAGTLNNTGSVTLRGTSTLASSGFTLTFGANVSAINYAGAATVAAFSAPANPAGLTINSASTVALPEITLVKGLTNLSLNANSSGSITIGTVPATIGGWIQNSGTGTGPSVISAAIANSSAISNIFQNSATSPLILSAANTYTNAITVTSGSLLVNGSLSAGPAPLNVYSGGAMGGIGAIVRQIVIQPGGTLAPGTNVPTVVGTLTISSNLVLAGNLSFKLNKTGTALTNDYVKMTGAGTLTNLGTGTLTLTNIGTTAIVNGDKFYLFSGPVIGGAAITVVSPLGQFTNNLAVDGSVIAGNPAPTITAISPGVGSSSGGTTVTITGTGFSSTVGVTFGGSSGTLINVSGSTSISVETPAHVAGIVPVVVVNSDGQTATNSFTFAGVAAPVITSVSPTSGPTSGGTTVTVTGNDFLNGDTVEFGSHAPVAATIVNVTTLTAVSPANAGGCVNITVADANSQSAVLTNGFVYVPPIPAIWIAPNGGGDGLWTGDAGNWSNNIVANAADQTADFSQGDYVYQQSVHVDSTNVVAGDLIFGTTDTGEAVQWMVDNNGTPGNMLTLATATGTPTITVRDPLALGNSVVLDTVLGGTNGFILTGGGMLTLGNAGGTITNSLTGGITIANGTLFINNDSGDGKSTEALTLGSTNLGSSATLFLGGSAFPYPIILPAGAQGNLTIGGDEDGPYHAVISGPGINLNSNTLSFVAPPGSTGSSYFQNGVTGSGNLNLVQNGLGTVLNKGTFANTGVINLEGFGSGTFNLGTMSGISQLNYITTSATVAAPILEVSASGTTINSYSPFNLPVTGGITIGAGGDNLILNADNSGNILIAAVDYRLGGSIVNSGTGAGTTTISAGIFSNSGISNIIENSATSPLVLSGANYYPVPTLVSNGTLMINGPLVTSQKGSKITVSSGGVLSGTGGIANLVTIQPGGTLAPGTNDGMTIGTLTITNGNGFAGALSLSGNLLFKVNNSGSQLNDYVTGSTLLTNLAMGTLTIVNVGPALNLGDRFQLFSQPLINGNALTIAGPTSFINNLAVDGSITVGTASSTPPTGVASLQGYSLSVVWQGGAGQNCVVLSATNLAQPVTTWTPVATNMVDGSGLFTNLFPVSAGQPQQFYQLEIP
jgi:autotransporter-associated beta strand protein